VVIVAVILLLGWELFPGTELVVEVSGTTTIAKAVPGIRYAMAPVCAILLFPRTELAEVLGTRYNEVLGIGIAFPGS
jgi:hypothetical protein